jgi:hypothetical protein
MRTPVELLLTVANIGGHITSAGDKLRTLLPPDCPPELKEEIRQRKPALLDLMRLTFLIVRSEVLDAVVFFTPDDVTREALIASGADPGSIYTRAELEVLLRQRITPQELGRIHAAKKQFNGTITNR